MLSVLESGHSLCMQYICNICKMGMRAVWKGHWVWLFLAHPVKVAMARIAIYVRVQALAKMRG